MSMRDYAVDDYGLVLDSNAMHIIASKVFDDLTDEEWAADVWGCAYDACDKAGLEYICDFTGEVFDVEDDGLDDYRSGNPYRNDTLFYMPLSEHPRLFVRTYKNMNEIVAELRLRLGRYLPDNFDYRGNFKHVVGTYFG